MQPKRNLQKKFIFYKQKSLKYLLIAVFENI